jgi:hypothetical protein
MKDEARRRIVLLLHEKGALSYVDMMKSAEVTSTGKMNYHLKVLGGIITKTAEGQYTLTEKGKLASRLLLEFPQENMQPMGIKPAWWRRFWVGIGIMAASVSVAMAAAYFLGYVDSRQLYGGFFAILAATGIAYMLQHITKDVLLKKARLTLNRIAFLVFGTFIFGFFLWIGLMAGLHASGIVRALAREFGGTTPALVSFVACDFVGALIGSWIGKKREYRLPQFPV